jgi:hypothetical protein
VPGHDVALRGIEPAPVAHGGVPLHVPDGAHAGDHGGDGLLAEHVAQGHLGELVIADAEIGRQRVGVLLDLRLPVTAEVAVAEVPAGKAVPSVIRPVRPPSSSATRTMTPTPCWAQAGSSSSSGAWWNAL